MPKDVIVVVNLDTMARPAEALDILLISTQGAKPYKVYRSLDQILEDYPAQTGENQRVYKKAAAIFNQGKTTLADALIRKIGVVGFDPPTDRAGNFPKFSITFSAPQFETAPEAETEYSVQIGGNAQSVVAVATGESSPTTAAQIAALFAGASFELDGVVFTGVQSSGGVVTFTGDAMTKTGPLTNTVEFYADDALLQPLGLSQAAYSAAYTNGNAEMQPAEALIADIEALQERHNDWYMFLTDQDGDDFVRALAKFAQDSEPTEAELGAGVEDHRKFYFGQTDNRELDGAFARSAIIYADTENLGEEADAAYLGNVGPFWPRSVTWKFKRPDGITLPDLSDAERDALEEANINFMTEEYKRQYVKNGVCWNGEFIDIQMGADYIANRMRNELYDVLLQTDTVTYDDVGFSLTASAVFAALNRGVDLGIVARDPESNAGVFTVAVPRRSEATDEQARERSMPDIPWDALVQGAVHTVKVRGTLRASMSA